MRFALDTQTPEDIAVRSVERVSEDFHALSRDRKTYQFKVDIGKPRSPFRRFMLVISRIPLISKNPTSFA